MNKYKHISFLSVLIQHDQKIVLRFKGRSMEPTIPSDCYVIIQKRPNQLLLNSIYVYSYNKKIICHRLIEQAHDGTLIFKGDNCLQSDCVKINFQNIIGECIGFILNEQIVYFGDNHVHS